MTLKTFFQPDEYYQSLEPAHKLVFSYGYTTWEWHNELRSSLHPLIYTIGYWLLSISPYCNREFVLLVPKVISALIAAIGETYLYVFAKSYSNNESIGQWTLVLSILSPFNWYMITRSFSNTLEMVLTTIALATWPWRRRGLDSSIFLSCCFAFISCIMRPPTAVFWVILGLYHMIGLTGSEMLKLGVGLAGELLAILSCEALLNYKFYGKWVFPIYNFIEFNIIKKLSIFYGFSPWHFHIFQSIPIILMTYLPFFIYSVYRFKLYYNILGITCLITIALFSFIDHKEFRFLYPLSPIFLLFTAYSFKFLQKKRFLKYCISFMVILNVAIAYFFSQVHERGVIDVINYLSETDRDFGFLTPCHSTPWQSHLHNNLSSWFITCEPPLHLQSTTIGTIKQYRDESDQMYDDPRLFMAVNFPPTISLDGDFKYAWPSQLVIFDSFDIMALILQEKGYRECQRFFNSYFHWDDRRNGYLVVYCKF